MMFSPSAVHRRDLPPFPTRRSSDLGKLDRKGADLIVANDVSAPGAGFEHDTNAVVIVAPNATTPVALRHDDRSEEHTSELQSRPHLVCRLLLEKKKKEPPPEPLSHA